MRFPIFRVLLSAITLVFSSALRADPAEDAVSAVMKLRSRSEYTWDVTTSKPGELSYSLPRTKHGSMSTTGEMSIEQIWSDGLVLETISRPNGAAVVRTPDGWFTKKELSELSRKPKRGSNSSKWIRLATEAFELMTPEEELTHLLNDASAYERDGDNISGTLTERGATYWLGSTRLIPKATGTFHLRLRDGYVRECRINAESEQLHLAFETTFTFNYSVSPPPIPLDARQKLDDLSRR